MSEGLASRSELRHGVTHHRVLAGFDGSVGSTCAAEWAAAEAVARDSSLQIVMAQTMPDPVDFTRAAARRATQLQQLAARLSSAYPLLDLDVVTTVADPRDALLAKAQAADLLVIGAHESGAAARLLFGSVERTAARRSACPVVVFRGAAVLRPMRRIVVGVDGSNAAEAALVWAAREAELHDAAELVAVHGWDRTVHREEAQQIVDSAVCFAQSLTGLSVRGELADGDGTAALTKSSLDADLLAIGSRGRSGFRTLLFGSVALTVAEQSSCPVAVTHPQLRQAG